MQPIRPFARKLIVTFMDQISNADMLAGMLFGAWQHLYSLDDCKRIVDEEVSQLKMEAHQVEVNALKAPNAALLAFIDK